MDLKHCNLQPPCRLPAALKELHLFSLTACFVEYLPESLQTLTILNANKFKLLSDTCFKFSCHLQKLYLFYEEVQLSVAHFAFLPKYGCNIDIHFGHNCTASAAVATAMPPLDYFTSENEFEWLPALTVIHYYHHFSMLSGPKGLQKLTLSLQKFVCTLVLPLVHLTWLHMHQCHMNMSGCSFGNRLQI